MLMWTCKFYYEYKLGRSEMYELIANKKKTMNEWMEYTVQCCTLLSVIARNGTMKRSRTQHSPQTMQCLIASNPSNHTPKAALIQFRARPATPYYRADLNNHLKTPWRSSVQPIQLASSSNLPTHHDTIPSDLCHVTFSSHHIPKCHFTWSKSIILCCRTLAPIHPIGIFNSSSHAMF